MELNLKRANCKHFKRASITINKLFKISSPMDLICPKDLLIPPKEAKREIKLSISMAHRTIILKSLIISTIRAILI